MSIELQLLILLGLFTIGALPLKMALLPLWLRLTHQCGHEDFSCHEVPYRVGYEHNRRMYHECNNCGYSWVTELYNEDDEDI
jgi:hypothetical protein